MGVQHARRGARPAQVGGQHARQHADADVVVDQVRAQQQVPGPGQLGRRHRPVRVLQPVARQRHQCRVEPGAVLAPVELDVVLQPVESAGRGLLRHGNTAGLPSHAENKERRRKKENEKNKKKRKKKKKKKREEEEGRRRRREKKKKREEEEDRRKQEDY